MKCMKVIKFSLMFPALYFVLMAFATRARADFTFGQPTNLGPTVNSVHEEWDPDISSNGLLLFFNSKRPGGFGGSDIWVATRLTKGDEWDTPENLGPSINTAHEEFGPSISADRLELYFCSDQPGGYGERDLWVTTRSAISEPWSKPVNLGPTVNSSSIERNPSISADGLSLFFASERSGGSGGYDLYVTTRETTNDEWGTPVNLGPTINSSSNDTAPDISPDGLYLFFGTKRPGGSGTDRTDLWFTRRASTSHPWELPVWLGPTINSSYSEINPCISADGSTLYFISDRPGGPGNRDIWQAPITPIVDLNGDVIVDSADMCIIVDNWGTDDSLCDIGPKPWGDGVVDVQDLIILAEHLFEEIFSPELVAYWKLDEVESDITYNSVSDNHGTLSGNPTWQPDNGVVAGALQFDGIDDYISTDFVLNPADGSFSVFACVKGGATRQVIISQTDSTGTGETWLGIDASEGTLMTQLGPSVTRKPTPPLVSDVVITDNDWHHIGLVWNTSYRTLYVDGLKVAEDTNVLAALKSLDGGLYIGTNENLDIGTFFSGLIDDVRIYNVALTAEEIAALAQ